MEIKDKDQPKNIPGITLGINIAVGMVLFTFIGNWVDQKLGDKHVWILVGMLLGLFYCGYEIWKLIRFSKEEQIHNNQTKSP